MIQPVEKFKLKTWHKVVLGILVAFFGLMAIAVNSETPAQKEERVSDQPAAAVAQPAITVNAVKFYNDYTANEVAADEIYKGKKLQITGKVESINKDFTDDIYINLQAGEYQYVRCDISKDNKKQAASLSKGQTITIMGEGATMVVGIPMVTDCTIQQ